MSSNTRPDVSFSVHKFTWLTHDTKAFHYMAVNRIHWFLQGIMDKGLVFNLFNIMVLDCSVDEYFAGLLGHENS